MRLGFHKKKKKEKKKKQTPPTIYTTIPFSTRSPGLFCPGEKIDIGTTVLGCGVEFRVTVAGSAEGSGALEEPCAGCFVSLPPCCTCPQLGPHWLRVVRHPTLAGKPLNPSTHTPANLGGHVLLLFLPVAKVFKKCI